MNSTLYLDVSRALFASESGALIAMAETIGIPTLMSEPSVIWFDTLTRVGGLHPSSETR
jgi:hypothetical protein